MGRGAPGVVGVIATLAVGLVAGACAAGSIGGEGEGVGRDGGMSGNDARASSDAEVGGDGGSLDVGPGTDANGSDDADVFVPPPECLGGDDVVADSTRAAFSEYAAFVTVEPVMGTTDGVPTCRRRYALSSDAPRRQDANAGRDEGRVFEEYSGAPLLRSGHMIFDALYALALQEVREASVEQIRDGAFDHGQPLACPTGGCFETGALWSYVWTRDTAYATDLALALVDPTRAANSLLFKVSARRDLGRAALVDRGDADENSAEIVQDTGTGGSYPISTDRVVWALAAAEVEKTLTGEARETFRRQAFDALRNTIEHDRRVVFDEVDGLYRGESSFLDWREQTYPRWAADPIVPIGESKALSTNVLHLFAIEYAAKLARHFAEAEAASRFDAWSARLRDDIRKRFDRPTVLGFGIGADGPALGLGDGLASRVGGAFDRAPNAQLDLLATSLAVLLDIFPKDRARAFVAAYPRLAYGPPVVFPEVQDIPIYHNRAIWPFVTAYAARAARHVGNAAVVAHDARSLIRGAALNLSNMENLEVASGLPWIDDGAMSGPVVNSMRQLWSVAGYLSMVHQTIFGLELETDGFSVNPFLPGELADALFPGVKTVVLNGVTLRGRKVTIRLRLPAPAAGSSGRAERNVSEVGAGHVVLHGARWWLNGQRLDDGFVADAWLSSVNLVDVDLEAVEADDESSTLNVIDEPSDYQKLFAPRTPEILGVRQDARGIVVSLASGERPEAITYDVYRDGERVARDLDGTSEVWVDSTPLTDGVSPCYAVESRFVSSGLSSDRSAPHCFWGNDFERVFEFPIEALDGRNGQRRADTTPPSFEFLDDPDAVLELSRFVPNVGGVFVAQAFASNDAGPRSTGITCGVLRIEVQDLETDDVVGAGYVAVPHDPSGRFHDSTSFEVSLKAGRAYRVRLLRDAWAINMSAYEHFRRYTGGAGGEQPFNRVKVSHIKLLQVARPL